MRRINFKRGWVDQVVPGEPFRMKMGVQLKEQILRKKLKEQGELYTVQEAAKILKVSDDTIYGWVNVGDERGRKLKCHRLGGRSIRISEAQIEEFIRDAENKAEGKTVRGAS